MTTISPRLDILRRKNSENNVLYCVDFLRLKNQADKLKFEDLISQPDIFVCDFIFDQVKELVKYKNPQTKFSNENLHKNALEHIGIVPIDEYGVWVYYPWSKRLIHVLDEEEFVEVRTSRNQYKITPNEKNYLSQKKIGVIGLSVGQSVSVTLAMERICGELRLADFDILELTNLNRIRTGIHNLGLAKVYSVAREIAEIDPFIKVVCYPDGLNESNMDDFFNIGGKLDLLVEESDGFDIKLLCRHKAKQLGIPVIMEASDRCMVDVERFDLEPNRDILHGLVNHLDMETLKKLKTNEEKIPYMLDVLGIETASVRLKASMLEIEQSINTWPQLASAVTMGGGITADVCRRMLLNQFTDSGRYYVDIEQLIGNSIKKEATKFIEQNIPAFDFEKQAQLLTLSVYENQLNLLKEEIEQIVTSACKAPSGGNSQPWRWIYKDKCLLLYNPYEPNASVLDYEGKASLIAIGTAIENLDIAANKHNLEVKIEFFPTTELNNLICVIRFFKFDTTIKPNLERYGAISYRKTNRQLGERVEIDSNILSKLKSAAHEIEGADLHFITNDAELDEVGEILGELEMVRLLDKQSHLEFVNEIRWTSEENDKKRDGVDLRTLDITNAEKAGLQISKNANVIGLVNEWNGGGAFKKLTKKSIASAGAIGVLTMPKANTIDYIKGGRALQKIWLEANVNDVAFQPMSASLFLYIRLLNGNGIGLDEKTIFKLKAIRPRFERIFQLTKKSQEIFIFRLCKSGEPKVVSLRKPLEELFCYY